MKRAVSNLSNKVIIRKGFESDGEQVVVSVYFLIACVRPYLSIINTDKCTEELKNFISECETSSSTKSTELPSET